MLKNVVPDNFVYEQLNARHAKHYVESTHQSSLQSSPYALMFIR